MEPLLPSWAAASKSLTLLSLLSNPSVFRLLALRGTYVSRKMLKELWNQLSSVLAGLTFLLMLQLAIFLCHLRICPLMGFEQLWTIDSVGTFTMCRAALEYIKKGGPGRSSSSGGTILNISATLHYTAAWYQIHVSAAKAAVDAITRNLALEWGTDYDVKVNGIAPGPIGDTTGMSKLAPDEINSKAREYMPLYKLGEKWDIAMAALYLASDAGKYINGATLIVDGGLWLSQPRRLPKEAVKQLSRTVEKRSRDAPVGVPTSKL
ncbi:hypothetical protein F0562_008574 [Nyssa sinensis]|uniref:2,4-dienoyl-CoA reductase [(3E)-enoyl-CoA-producing] n=1 Tax=Nyssa sinensis TaxID=561372 RepID=A0A5J5ACI9_9ASTE|nr:hypothetical protein F0562_008574 [Nyssa sinensis]